MYQVQLISHEWTSRTAKIEIWHKYYSVLPFCIKEWGLPSIFQCNVRLPWFVPLGPIGLAIYQASKYGIIYEAVIHQHLFISSSMFRFQLFSLHDIVNMETTKKVNVIIEKQEVQSLLISMKWYCCPTQKEIFTAKLGYPLQSLKHSQL